MGDFDRNAGRGRSGRGRFDRPPGRGGFGGRDRGDGRGRGSFGGFRGRDRRSERHEMHSAVCDKCGKDCEVPFRPTEGKPIYCEDCYKNKSRESGSRSEFGKPKSNENLDQINKKLDKIIRLLEGKKEPVEKQPVAKKQKSLEEDIKEEQPKEKKEKSEKKPEVKTEEPKLEYVQDIEEKKPKKKKAKKKKS